MSENTAPKEKAPAPAVSATAPAKPSASEDYAALVAERDKLAKIVSERNAESKASREKAEKAEREKAEAEGNFVKLREIDGAERKRLTDELAALAPKITRADRLEAVVTARVAELEKAAGAERAKSVAHLSPEDRLPILEQFAVLAAGGGAAPRPAAGAPANGARALPDFSKMGEAEQRAWFYGATDDEKDLARQALGQPAQKRSAWLPIYSKPTQ